ncbi:MAG: tRNA (guanosine(46)-N7)-methyltransferase TrmB [Clostridia bacterium]|nr:tRNA (guanosine(46)-N7)-methyltransferase TrmB [Clostridia bacterium]
MRMRKKKNGEQRITNCSQFLAPEKEEIFKNPMLPFENEAPICLEIGCGKGAFICTNAKNHPELNFYAMEKVRDVMVIALEKAMEQNEDDIINNLRFIIGDAQTLTEFFPPESLDRIYLNFSDPWPKKGHAKRRLTHISKLDIYKTLLKDGAELRLKTDNDGLFEFSLEQFKEAGFDVLWQTTDLHNSEYNKDNVMTEYERNFSEKGKNINAAVFVKRA